MTTATQTQAGSLAGPSTTDTLTANESAPTLATDGIDCDGFSQVAVSFHTFTGTSYDLEIWVYDGEGWAQAVDSAGAALDFDGNTATFAQVFNIAGFKRFLCRLNNSSALTTIKRTQRPVGPGV